MKGALIGLAVVFGIIVLYLIIRALGLVIF